MLSPPLFLSQRFFFLYPHSLSRHIFCTVTLLKGKSDVYPNAKNSPNGFLLSVGRQNSPLLFFFLNHLFFNCYAVPCPSLPKDDFGSPTYSIPHAGIPPSHVLTPANAFSSFKTYMTSHLCDTIFHVVPAPLSLSHSFSHSLPSSYSSFILTSCIRCYHVPL